MARASSAQQGQLRVLAPFEDYLDEFRAPAADDDSLGLIAEADPVKTRGPDSRITRLYRVHDLGVVFIEIPDGVTPERIEDENTGLSYWLVKLGDRASGITVHLHDELVGLERFVFSARAQLCVRTVNLIDAHGNDKGVRNYYWYLDLRPVFEEAVADKRLMVISPDDPRFDRPRNEALLFGKRDERGAIIFASRSIYWDPAHTRFAGDTPSPKGSNQCLYFVPFSATDPQVGAEYDKPPATKDGPGGSMGTMEGLFDPIDLASMTGL